MPHPHVLLLIGECTCCPLPCITRSRAYTPRQITSSPTHPFPDLGEAPRQKLVQFKGRAEDTLRNSGLGYTIVRPGPLKEEAGGYKALVFDQGNRIRQVRKRVAWHDV